MKTFYGDDDSYDEINEWVKIWRNAAGERHRDGDLPARIWANGDINYYKNDMCHRDGDLPAVIWADGTMFFYKNGEIHRDGGRPAVIWADGTEEYWVDGVKQK